MFTFTHLFALCLGFLAFTYSRGSPLTFLPFPADVQRSLPVNFTVAALNMSLPNANLTGAPLVLGQNGATGGAQLEVLSTWKSFPYNDFPALSLFGGQLRAFTKQGEWITNATAPDRGQPLGWLTSRLYHTTATDYSVVPVYGLNLVKYVLAANERADLWSLCSWKGPRGQTNVVFDVSASPPNPGYDIADCYGVWIIVVPALPVHSK